MNCKSYIELTVIERNETIQRLAHLFQTDEYYFLTLSSIVRQSDNNGLFDSLKIFPERNVPEILLEQGAP